MRLHSRLSRAAHALGALTVAALVPLVAAGCSGGGSPSATPTTADATSSTGKAGGDQAFLFNLNQAAPEVSHADAVKFEGLGHAVCANLNTGNSIQHEVTAMDNGNMAVDVVHGVLAGAVDGYCPRFEHALTDWVNSQPSPR
jgi:hypothetical protein